MPPPTLNPNRARRALTAGALVPLAAIVAAGCGSTTAKGGATTGSSEVALAKTSAGKVTCASPASAKGPGVGTKAIGFIYVGATTDVGYNQAAHDGAVALRKACPKVKVLEADNIPETADMTRVAEQMIGQGAKIIFTTSYGYKDFAVKLAKAHPDVAVLQQGNFIDGQVPPNVDTYFGNVYETVYLGGIAAAKATKSKKLGFIAAFAIPQTLVNINAFELGAQSVDPTITTNAVFVGDWCDPGKQADAARSLLASGVDVVSQHQDCTGTIVKTTEAKGASSVGYHYDAEKLAPKGWLTGSEWDWAPLYGALTTSIMTGKFTSSPFKGNYTVGFSGGEVPSPMKLAPFGPSVADPTKAEVDKAKKAILGGRSPFTGPVVDKSGKVQVAKGASATSKQIATMDFLVKGVKGSLPK